MKIGTREEWQMMIQKEREREIDITLVQGDNHMWHPNDCTLGLVIRL